VTGRDGGCFGEAAAAQLVTGALVTAERERLTAHADGCPACRQRLAEAAQVLVSRGTSVVDAYDDEASDASTAALTERGARVGGRYVVLDTLGSGGMGHVYLAHDGVLRREVALKLTRRASATALTLLEREARAIATVRHPNVLTVYDLVVDDGRVAIAMERIRGPTLRAWLATEPGRRAAVERLLAVGEGLAAAHAAGVVHGDVKPDNALVDERGDVKLADFGLARILRDTGAGARGVTGGTALYLAPEVSDGGEPSERADQYALAATWVESFGRRPRRDEDEPWTAGPLARCPRWMRRPLRRALDSDPERRFASVSALNAALRRARRRRRLSMMAAAVVAIAAPLLIASGLERAAFDRCMADTHAAAPPPIPAPDLEAVADEDRRELVAQAWRAAEAYRGEWVARWTEAHASLCREGELAESARVSRCLDFERAWLARIIGSLEPARPLSFDNRRALGQISARARDLDCESPTALAVFGVVSEASAIEDAATLLALGAQDDPAELDALVARLEPLGPSQLLGWAFIQRQRSYSALGDRPASIADGRQALYIAQALGDRELEALAWTELSEVVAPAGSGSVEAQFYLENALAVSGRPRGPGGVAAEPITSPAAGDAAARPSLRLLLDALDDGRRLERPFARTLNLVGNAHLELGEPELAERAYAQALAERRLVHRGDHTRTAGAIHNLALAAYARGEWERARALAEEALRMRRAVLPEAHAEVGRIELTVGTIRVEVDGDPGGLEQARSGVAKLGGSAESGDLEAARGWFRVADLALAVGAFADADAIVTQAWAAADGAEIATGPALAEAALVRADLAWRSGRHDEARRLLSRVRRAPGDPLSNPWTCPRFAALAALLGVAPVDCRALPVAPFGETAALRASATGPMTSDAAPRGGPIARAGQ